MSWKYISAKRLHSGERVDGYFLGRGLLVVDLPQKKRPYVHWIKKLMTEVILWIGAKY